MTFAEFNQRHGTQRIRAVDGWHYRAVGGQWQMREGKEGEWHKIFRVPRLHWLASDWELVEEPDRSRDTTLQEVRTELLLAKATIARLERELAEAKRTSFKAVTIEYADGRIVKVDP